MCGIAGIIGLEANKSAALIEEMTESMSHRGPDAGNSYTDGKLAFGHRRLSIIDLTEAANQPFHDEGRRYSIVFNGEIYNYKEIRDSIDYPWRTHSDTEVVLASFLKWGPDCLNKFHGMFAFAIWDREREQLFMARDRFGVKPFYYSLLENCLVFSSDFRTVLKSVMVPKKLDEVSLLDYLSFMAVRSPGTIIENVDHLNPGHYATYSK
jgi:asparagine synthase (glutamine-hydrolysing)